MRHIIPFHIVIPRGGVPKTFRRKIFRSCQKKNKVPNIETMIYICFFFYIVVKKENLAGCMKESSKRFFFLSKMCRRME